MEEEAFGREEDVRREEEEDELRNESSTNRSEVEVEVVEGKRKRTALES